MDKKEFSAANVVLLLIIFGIGFFLGMEYKAYEIRQAISDTTAIDNPITDILESKKDYRDSDRLSDMRMLQTALELYYTDNSSYPITNGDKIELGTSQHECLGYDGFTDLTCDYSYLNPVPKDPSNNRYMYSSMDGESYRVEFYLETSVNGYVGKTILTPFGFQK